MHAVLFYTGRDIVEVGYERFHLKACDGVLVPREIPHPWAFAIFSSFSAQLCCLAGASAICALAWSPANPPASTAVQVPRLFRHEFVFEIEAIAVVKKN
jgi:hypothetical protein